MVRVIAILTLIFSSQAFASGSVKNCTKLMNITVVEKYPQTSSVLVNHNFNDDGSICLGSTGVDRCHNFGTAVIMLTSKARKSHLNYNMVYPIDVRYQKTIETKNKLGMNIRIPIFAEDPTCGKGKDPALKLSKL